MAIKINSNGQSLLAQRQVAQTGDALGRVFERLSSGQRINRASDDAAGLAIADTLNSKSRVFTTGVKNLNDGISALSIADGATDQLSTITTRLVELAEQSSNGSYSSKQRKALDDEAQALSSEFTRIVQTTSFNGIKLFDGSTQGLRLQAGYGVQGSINASLGGAIGTGNFTAGTTFGTGGIMAQLSDLNGDGFLDMVTANYGGGSVAVSLGDGNGNFGTFQTFAVGTNPGSVAVGDVNGDGAIDIVTSNNGSNNVSVLLGNGKGSFGAATNFATNNGPGFLGLTDLNRDGILDIVTANQGAPNLAVLLGNGGGGFGAATTYASTQIASSISFGDINGDGVDDILGVQGGGDEVSILLADGKGGFGALQTFSVAGADNINSAKLGDFNGDGKLDFVVSDKNLQKISIFSGDGKGSFTLAKSFDVDNEPINVDAADFNGDGLLDIIVSQSDLSIFLNDGKGGFGPAQSIGLGGDGSGVFGDLNSDGVLDMVVSFGSNVSVFKGMGRDGVNAILPFSLRSQGNARQALSQLQNKLSLLSAQRGVIGASQSRITTAISVLQSATENFKAAESRIRDTDVAKDAADLARLQILQQAGISVLSQANLQPQLALKLLRN